MLYGKVIKLPRGYEWKIKERLESFLKGLWNFKNNFKNFAMRFEQVFNTIRKGFWDNLAFLSWNNFSDIFPEVSKTIKRSLLDKKNHSNTILIRFSAKVTFGGVWKFFNHNLGITIAMETMFTELQE